MRIVPVIDLKAGRAVHARGGDRRLYRPLLSRLGGGSPEPLDDPARLAALYEWRLRPEWIYVADLDRIGGGGDNIAALRAIHDAAPRCRLLWDGGFADREAAAAPFDRVEPILASETLRSPGGLRSERAGPAWLGIDLTAGGMHAAAPEVGSEGEVALLRRAVEAGLRGVVAVLVDRIGTGAGLPIDRLARLRETAPGLPLCAGGGIATLADLAAISAVGCDGALVATALHDGRLLPEDLRDAGYV
jgi:phosphoribosylformimino-5-aminoimidazole carboxamide ribotide isomerase